MAISVFPFVASSAIQISLRSMGEAGEEKISERAPSLLSRLVILVGWAWYEALSAADVFGDATRWLRASMLFRFAGTSGATGVDGDGNGADGRGMPV